MGQHNDNDNNYSKYFKVIIVGNPETGKTSIMKKFIYDEFDSNYKKSITPISYNKYIQRTILIILLTYLIFLVIKI